MKPARCCRRGRRETDDDIPDLAEPGDAFGSAISVGGFGTGGAIAVGAPGEAVGSTGDACAMHILPGGPGGIAIDGDQRWTLDSAGVAGTAAAGDRLGAAAD